MTRAQIKRAALILKLKEEIKEWLDTLSEGETKGSLVILGDLEICDDPDDERQSFTGGTILPRDLAVKWFDALDDMIDDEISEHGITE